VRWVRYSRAGSGARVGALVEGVVHGTEASSMVDVLADGGLEALTQVALHEPVERRELAEVDLLAPLVDPPSIRDFMAFEQHVEGMGLLVGATPPVPEVWFEQPLFYFSNPASIVGPFDDVAVPPGCTTFDFELEVACVIGRSPARTELSDLTLAEAEQAIAGYVLLNDWSARDLQAVEMRGPLGPCKGKDSAISLGPFLVTPQDLTSDDGGGPLLASYVNDRPVGGQPLAAMAWSFPELVSYASRGTRLRPGDLIGSGTCGGGCLAEHWGRGRADEHPPLAVGDVVRLEGGVLGATANRVVAGSPVRQPLARRA
jgi:2-keto-4-pentenoate hydratase/2-oxohepta-3-ene-1,7-dioic acid hydratase in catechol pathway